MKRFQIIQGGRIGPVHPTKPGRTLYKAHSLSNLTRGKAVFHDVLFHWYCLERVEPPLPYELAIADYDRLDPLLRGVMEKEVKRFFTEDETNALRSYLQGRYGMQLNIERISLPIERRITFFEEGTSVVYDFLELSEREGYSLPFKVWGYYTVEGCLTSPILEKGIEFLEKALDRLGLSGTASRTELESVSRSLFNEEGLFVTSREKS